MLFFQIVIVLCLAWVGYNVFVWLFHLRR